MKKNILKLIILSLCLFISEKSVYADNISEAANWLRKAEAASIQDQSYDFIHKARILYQKEYDDNPTNIEALLGLSKVNQLLGDRPEAKLYVLKAYNMEPSNPRLQRAMGDFFFSFQEYSTAIEYYKLALASGLLKDFDTNLQTAKCFEKLGDTENSELYYKISGHVNSKSKEVQKKLNAIESSHRPDDSQELDNLKYKYLFKDRKLSESEKTEKETDDLIESINAMF